MHGAETANEAQELAWMQALCGATPLETDHLAVSRCQTSFALVLGLPEGSRDAENAWLRLGTELAAEGASAALLAHIVRTCPAPARGGDDTRALAPLLEGYLRFTEERARETAERDWLGSASVVSLREGWCAVACPPAARPKGTGDPEAVARWASSVAALCAKRGVKHVLCNDIGDRAREELVACLQEVGVALEATLPEAQAPKARPRLWPFSR